MACFLVAVLLFLAVPSAAFAAFNVSLSANPAQPHSDTQAVLKWNPVAGAQLYEILRNTGGAFVPVGTIDPDGVLEPTTYIDLGLTPNTAYTYQLKAYLDTSKQNAVALSYNETTFTTSGLIRPDGMSAVYNINTKNVTLSWETDSEAAAGCVVRVGNESGAIVATAVYGANTITFATANTEPVNYVVVSNDGAGGHVSAASNPVTVTPITPPVVTAAGVLGNSNLSWGNFSPIADFYLERAKWSGTAWSAWQEVATQITANGATDAPDTGGVYRYRLSAKNSGSYAGQSNASNNVSCPRAPKNLTAAIVTNSLTGAKTIDLHWTNDPGNESILKVGFESDTSFFNFIASLPKSAASYSLNVPVELGITYSFVISAWYTDQNYTLSPICSVTALMPGAPSNLTLRADSKASVTLSWQDNSTAEQQFVIERKKDSGSFVNIGTVAAKNITYTDATIEADHTYAYRVLASNTMGLSAYSNTVSIIVNNIIIPNALTAAAVSSSQIDLAWSYPGNGKYGTVIERKTGTDGTWSILSTTPAGFYTYSDSGLSADTQYFYRVRNSMGSGITTPSYPDNDSGIGAYTRLNGLSLSGEAVSGGRIRLTWSGALAGTDVVIERKMASGNFSVLGTVNTSVSEWYDTTGLIPGASYIYRIKARNSSNESAYSRELTVANVYLDSPSDLDAKPDSNNTITLTWKDNSDGETGFEIWRRVYGTSTYILYAKVGRNETRYTDKDAQSGVQYYYRVRAYLNQGELYSGYAATVSAGVDIIDPPDDLAYDYVSDTTITLTWDDNSDDESGFRIERRIGQDGDWQQIATVSRNTESYKYTGLNPNVKYFFRIRAYNGSGSFDSFSNEVEITTGKPKAPSNVSVGSISSFQAKITWKDNSDNEAGFKLQRAIVGITNYTTVAYVGKDITSYTDNGLSSGTQYSYKVSAYNESGESASVSAEAATGIYITFKDVTAGFWAWNAIVNLAGRGIIKGKTETKFMPGDTITRAEFTALMIRAFNLETAPVGSFADVKIGRWYYDEVMVAENLGIISGDAGNKFYPDRVITREEMAVIIANTLNVVGKPLNAYGNGTLEKFWDRDLISPYALSSIASIVGEGLMTGLPGNAIAPKKTLTRAEAAAIIYRILDR